MVPAGKVLTTLTIQRITVRQPTPGRPVAVLAPMPTPRTTQTNTRSGSKPMPKPKCLPLRLPKAGSTGHGVPSLLHSGVTARRGRMDSCPKRHTRLLSSAEMMFLTFPGYRNIIDLHEICPVCSCLMTYRVKLIFHLALAFLAQVYNTYYIDYLFIHTPGIQSSISVHIMQQP